ncbi:hypothetical protein PaecuDRAFT_4113 [Paenibacillus curdlanolyticus YK9]|uniref:Lipoprotein n=1 Tax=Paenibacillus curdlanolyticus YK9 TaxID=717606 RepID=E0IEM2_9BACL|nr:DUF6612 family protein [Paenibacillus curdlanolyticus]EFM09110.1 hypothetical protein PaecuDRAFT_4113 [Paenibacillus curdlanolyticus YK9]
MDKLDQRRNHQIKGMRALLAVVLLLAGIVLLAACSSEQPAQQDKRAVPSASKAEESVAASEAAAIREELAQSAQAASNPAGWAITLKLDQQLDENGQPSKMNMTSEGPVRREPLQLKQTIISEYGGETSKMETILTPDGYYMHDMTSDDWTRMAKSVIPQVKETLSDYQIMPSEPIERLATASEKLQRTTTADGGQIQYVYTGDGKDAGARALIDDILRGTFGGSAMTQEVVDSIAVEQFEYKQSIDAQTKLPAKVGLKLELTIELQAGHRSKLSETLDVSYSKWNESTAITVPDSAKQAEEVTPPTPEQLEEVDRLLGQ